MNEQRRKQIIKRHLFDRFSYFGTDPITGKESCFDRSGGGEESPRNGNERTGARIRSPENLARSVTDKPSREKCCHGDRFQPLKDAKRKEREKEKRGDFLLRWT